MPKPYWTPDNFPIAPQTRNPGGSKTFRSGTWRILKPILDQTKCNKCGLCHKFCPDGVVDITELGDFEINYTYCKGCGICANECPQNAIQMILEGGKED